ncbi:MULTISPECIES: hypothetical protein [Halorussus]|uniref:hypothetical protein n=1 Tax=Halorussus TaxID=1070314 RepID=UPI000E20FF44|nr:MULTISPECIES: hypothetical protein [Halorussus]NHN60948.1 hypothetical protein [Halorussus sp. JP-T4]
MSALKSLFAYWKRLHAAVHVDSPWRRAIIGGVSGLSGALLADAVTQSYSLRLLTIFVVTTGLMVVLSALANHLQ